MKGNKKTQKKIQKTSMPSKDKKLKEAQDRIKAEREAFKNKKVASPPVDGPKKGKKNYAQIKNAVDPKTYTPIIKAMDEGVQKEIDVETRVWNERKFTTEEYKGSALDRFPLSASQGGKCALALARSVSHYLGVAHYPRSTESITPRVQRIFARGHLLESALISDLTKYTHFKPVEQQRRVRLFTLGGGKRHIEGNIDAILYNEADGTRILTDFKSKGAFHSSAFQDTISQFFQELKQTGLVEEPHPNCFFITDAWKLFNTISMEEFFIDYLIQLNAYAFAVTADEGAPLPVDFVALYYENKNTCANYEVRWKPDRKLFEFLEKKFNFIYDNVREVATLVQNGATKEDFDTKLEFRVPKEYALGSPRCKLCDYNELCWGKYDPTLKPSGNVVIELPEDLAGPFRDSLSEETFIARLKENVLNHMAKQDATHITIDGMCFERKYLKSPKPHYELRQVQKPLRQDNIIAEKSKEVREMRKARDENPKRK